MKLAIFSIVTLVSIVSTVAFNKDSSAKDLLVVTTPSANAVVRDQFSIAAQFFGLTLDTHVLQARQDDALEAALSAPDLLAVMIDADALPLLDRSAVLASLQHHDKPVPLMIAGVNEHTNRSSLEQWSGGAVSGAEMLAVAGRSAYHIPKSPNGMTGALAGAELGFSASKVYGLDVGSSSQTRQDILILSDPVAPKPAFVRVPIQNMDLYIAAQSDAIAPPASADPARPSDVFASLAAPMLFLHSAGGDRVWHSPANYANLTIDDPRLRQPYGHVDFEQLLQHARAHNFFVTIAFIPWNFDRSEPAAVDLFRNNPDRFSISVHGNDHLRGEFGPLASTPLNEQRASIRQGLARMNAFSALTQIPYDAVFVFPYSIGPEATLGELRKHRYAGTVNRVNVPLDAKAPETIDFALRTTTLQFGGAFPSLRRYHPSVAQSQLAVDAFLGNPILFYGHEGLFSDGIAAFDKVADDLNGLQPATQWKSLGYILQHSYLEKQRSEGKYDLRAYSSDLKITNSHGVAVEYVLEKDEDFSHGVTVLLDGQSVPFTRAGDRLQLTFTVPKDATREFSVRSDDQVDVAGVDIAKTSLRANLIRWLSDFRDNHVSGLTFGHLFGAAREE